MILSLDEERDRIVIFRGVRTVRHNIFPVQTDLDDRRNQILFTIDEVERVSLNLRHTPLPIVPCSSTDMI